MGLNVRRKAGRLGGGGFTLIELQVSLCLLLLMAAGSASVLIGYMRQIQWLEKQNAMQARCSADLKRVVFSRIQTGDTLVPLPYHISLQSLAPAGGDLEAVVCLVAP